MRRHHRQTHRYSGCSAHVLTPEENEILLDRFLESLNDKIDADEAARRDLPHGVIAASADGGIHRSTVRSPTQLKLLHLRANLNKNFKASIATCTSKSSPSTAPNRSVAILVWFYSVIANETTPEAQWEWLVFENDFAVADCTGQI